ncbi:MAG: methyltransferase domain-containing protein [Caldilineales bacterium]|nr:methyltransferase domain-containing protein [Caldilineales bacterium]
MNNQRNLQIYRLWAFVYDAWIPLLYGRARRRAVTLLDLQPGERLLIPGIGTGLDLPHIPAGVSIVGADLSPDMLAKAKAKAQNRDVTLLEMDVQVLNFADDTFDAVLFNLLLAVVPDGAAAFAEGWRTLKPGGRAVIFDKFLPEGAALTPGRRLLGRVLRSIGTDPNRRLNDIIAGTSDLMIESDEPSLLRGQYRTLLLRKKVGGIS